MESGVELHCLWVIKLYGMWIVTGPWQVCWPPVSLALVPACVGSLLEGSAPL